MIAIAPWTECSHGKVSWAHKQHKMVGKGGQCMVMIHMHGNYTQKATWMDAGRCTHVSWSRSNEMGHMLACLQQRSNSNMVHTCDADRTRYNAP